MVLSKLLQFFKRKDLFLYLILIIAGMGFYGWITGNMILASFSHDYIPIAPSNIVLVFILSTVMLLSIRFKTSGILNSILNKIVLLIAVFCLIIFLQYFLSLKWDIETAFVKSPVKFGNVLTGRMSPLTSLLYIFTCFGFLGNRQKSAGKFKFTGGAFTLLAMLLSSVLFIGYLYRAPLLYGGTIIPVSLPSVICFLLFSFTLLRVYEGQFWTFNLIKNNKVTRMLLKSFLPVVVFIIILQGFLVTNFPIVKNNPTLSVALILLLIITITIILLLRVSANIGDHLLTAEKQLKESEEKFRSITENSADAIFIADQQGKYTYTNVASTVMLGYSSDDYKHMTIADLTPPGRLQEYFGIFNKVLTEGRAFAEMELVKKDGKYLPTDLNAVLLPDGNVFASCRNTTERKQAEQALKDSDSKYRMIADYNYDWEFWLTTDKKFKYCSPSCKRISGYTPEDFYSNSNLLLQIMHPEDRHLYENHFNSHYNNQACDGIDFRIHTSSGEVRWINHVCQPIFADDGVHIGRRGSNSDITLRKLAEERIMELNRELKELNISKDRFLSILGHDLKSPFSNLLGLSEILVRDMHKMEINKIELFAGNIYQTLVNTYNLLEDILLWARSQQGNISFNLQKGDLEEICRNTLDILGGNAVAKNIVIDYSGTDQIIVYADAGMLRTIMRNLISNAIKFTCPGGSIHIHAHENKLNTIISVADNGVGISPENLSKLFDISQVLTTRGTADEEGTGLGLLLCKEFIVRHGGSIQVKSELGKGSSFVFTLPKRDH